MSLEFRGGLAKGRHHDGPWQTVLGAPTVICLLRLAASAFTAEIASLLSASSVFFSSASAPFAIGQISADGPYVDIAPNQALAISLTLQELATIAEKYGALSRPEGRIEVRWKAEHNKLCLSWKESGGPAVEAPSRRGFGSRLIESALSGDLDGQSRLEFAPEGVCCRITAVLAAKA